MSAPISGRLPGAVITLLSLAVIAMTGIGAVLILWLADHVVHAEALPFYPPFSGTPEAKTAWIEIALFGPLAISLWLLAILVIAAWCLGNHARAGANALWLSRLVVALLVLRFVFDTGAPALLHDPRPDILDAALRGFPLLLVEIALIVFAMARLRPACR